MFARVERLLDGRPRLASVILMSLNSIFHVIVWRSNELERGWLVCHAFSAEKTPTLTRVLSVRRARGQIYRIRAQPLAEALRVGGLAAATASGDQVDRHVVVLGLRRKLAGLQLEFGAEGIEGAR